MIANIQLRELINKLDDCQMNKVTIEINKINKLFNPIFVSVYDCVLLHEKEPEALAKSYERAIELHRTPNAYEVFCSDTRINDFFENQLTALEALSIGLLTIDIWGKRLKAIDEKANYCIILDCNDGYVTIRYHKVRDNENRWLADDIEDYDGPIGYIIV
jgi:hypothetical protein